MVSDRKLIDNLHKRYFLLTSSLFREVILIDIKKTMKGGVKNIFKMYSRSHSRKGRMEERKRGVKERGEK